MRPPLPAFAWTGEISAGDQSKRLEEAGRSGRSQKDGGIPVPHLEIRCITGVGGI